MISDISIAELAVLGVISADLLRKSVFKDMTGAGVRSYLRSVFGFVRHWLVPVTLPVASVSDRGCFSGAMIVTPCPRLRCSFSTGLRPSRLRPKIRDPARAAPSARQVWTKPKRCRATRRGPPGASSAIRSARPAAPIFTRSCAMPATRKFVVRSWGRPSRS